MTRRAFLRLSALVAGVAVRKPAPAPTPSPAPAPVVGWQMGYTYGYQGVPA